MRAPLGSFDHVRPAPEALDLLVQPVADAVRHWRGTVPAQDLIHVDTDPDWADTATFWRSSGANPVAEIRTSYVPGSRFVRV